MASILTNIERYFEFKTPVVWSNVLIFASIHIFGIVGLVFLPTAKPMSIAFSFLIGLLANTAVSGGAHRLWSHKSYKATVLMKVIVMICYMFSGEYSIRAWVRDHRAHHKFTDTDADPHSSARGLLYSHCGWLVMRRHPELLDKAKVIDISDLLQDPVIRFHQKYFLLLVLVFHIIFPSAVVYYVIGDTWQVAVFMALFSRYALSLNAIWCINSLAHYWGTKPYNNKISATSHAFLDVLLLGEGWHNYHHTFPWDYRNGEQGLGWQFTTHAIDVFAALGLAHDLKTVSPAVLQQVLAKRNLPKDYEVPESGLLE